MASPTLEVCGAGDLQNAVSIAAQVVTVAHSRPEWITPGSHLAQALVGRLEVRRVLERLEADRYQVFVVLDRDPEDLLDLIVDSERELYTRFPGLPFDVRVLCLGPDWSDADLQKACLVHYDRARVHGR